MQDALEEVMIPLNSDDLGSPQLASEKVSSIGRLRKDVTADGGEVSPFQLCLEQTQLSDSDQSPVLPKVRIPARLQESLAKHGVLDIHQSEHEDEDLNARFGLPMMANMASNGLAPNPIKLLKHFVKPGQFSPSPSLKGDHLQRTYSDLGT